MYKFGVDVGGTTVKIGLFSGDGKLEEKYEIATDKSDQGAHIIEHIAAKLDEIIAEKSYGILDCMGVGIGLPGPVDRGMILGCVNLGWGIFSIVEEFSKAFHNVPVYAGNDANIAALGEYVAGAGKGMKNMIMVTLGTGDGGGIIIDGRRDRYLWLWKERLSGAVCQCNRNRADSGKAEKREWQYRSSGGLYGKTGF